jgi:hypothetical protein
MNCDDDINEKVAAVGSFLLRAYIAFNLVCFIYIIILAAAMSIDYLINGNNFGTLGLILFFVGIIGLNWLLDAPDRAERKRESHKISPEEWLESFNRDLEIEKNKEKEREERKKIKQKEESIKKFIKDNNIQCY